MRQQRTLRQRVADLFIPQHTGASLSTRTIGGTKISQNPQRHHWSMLSVLSPPSPEQNWRLNLLDSNTLSRIEPHKLVEHLADLSPEVSKALWDFLRMINPGYEITVMNRSGTRKYTKGQLILDSFIATLNDNHGTLDILFNRLFMGAWMRGAFVSELVLAEDGRTPIDIVTVDPYVMRFRVTEDPLRGQIWQLGQYQSGKWVPMDDPTIRYVPVDPFPNSPYGRPLVAPALFATLFLLGLLHDLRRVVSQQGYPRLDLVVKLQELEASMPEGAADDPDTARAWVQAAIDEITTVYSSLEPDDAYVHTDVVEVNSPISALNASGLGAVEGLIRGVERMAIRALKTMPIFMGSNEAVAETHARWQWEIQSAGIRSLQHLAENMLEYLFGLVLRAQGIEGKVQVRFAELNELTRRHRAETAEIEIRNEIAKRDQGWTTQDEAALAITGHEAVEDAPVSVGQLEMTRVLRESVSDRVQINLHVRAEAEDVDDPEPLIGHDEPLPELPDDVVFDEEDIERAIRRWDDLMAEYGVDGLLDAEIDEEEEDKRSLAVRSVDPQWLWEPRAHRYRDLRTGRFIDQAALKELRDAWTDALMRESDDLVERLFAKQISVQDWVTEMRLLVKDAYSAQYMAARGGRNMMTQSDWGRVGRMVRDQYGYLQGFGEDLQDGKLSEAMARTRAQLYMESSTHAFEQSKRVSYALPKGALPQFPSDGGTQCLARCRCFWLVKEFADRWECTWVLDPSAQHCDDCLANAAEWSPLIIMKEEAT